MKKYQWMISVFIFYLLSQFVWGDVSSQLENLVLSEKWGEAKAVTLSENNAPTDILFVAYASLATSDYQNAVELFARLDSSTKLEKLSDDMSKLSQRYPKNFVAQMIRGDSLARNGNFEEALNVLDHACQLNPKFGLSYNIRGVVKAMVKNLEGALADFDKCMELMPEFADAYVNRGLVNISIGKLDEAEADFAKAIQLSPNFALAYNGRGLLAFLIHDWNSAASDFETANKLAPKIEWIFSNSQLASQAKAQADFSREVMVMGSRGTTMQAQTLVIDVAGIRSEGAIPRLAWKQALLGQGDHAEIRIRHEGALPSWMKHWPNEPNVITLSQKWNETELKNKVGPLLEKANRERKSVYVNIDANLSWGYLAGLKTGELQWAANVADTIAKTMSPETFKVFNSHSAGTEVPQLMKEIRLFNYISLESPRNFSHVEPLLKRMNSQAGMDLVRGKGDYLSWGNHQKVLGDSRVRVIELQKDLQGGPLEYAKNAGDIHSKVGNASTKGEFKISTSQGSVSQVNQLSNIMNNRMGSLRGQFISGKDGSIPNYWTDGRPSPYNMTCADTLISITDKSRSLDGRGNHALVAGDGPIAHRMIQDLLNRGWQVTHRPDIKNVEQLQKFGKQMGISHIFGVTSDIQNTSPKIGNEGGQTKMDSYRFSSPGSLENKRGGVWMKVEIVRKETLDTSDMFGNDSPLKEQSQLICPFLVFCGISCP